MRPGISQLFLRILAALILTVFYSVAMHAQDDPDPNSPTPVLLSMVDSTRALAQPADSYRKVRPNKITAQAFPPDTDIVLYVSNIELMKGEGAGAFRVYVQDQLGHTYRFPVLSVESNSFGKNLYALEVRLKDELGYWYPPAANGDVLVYVAWRGLASNVVTLGLGSMGGEIKQPPESKPTPLGIANGRTSTRMQSPDYVGYLWASDRKRFLEQATFGPTAALDNTIRRIGIKSWLAQQFEAPYPTFPYPNQPLMPLTPAANCDGSGTDDITNCFRDSYTIYPVQAWNSKEMFYGDAQLRHRVAWALSQIWVTSGVSVQQSRWMIEYHKILSANAFGNYRNLMKQMTLDATMGDYLDMIQSTKNNPNENYARELMQLFTVGLFMLNQDGTLQLDNSGTPIPTYDQNGVNNLTKVLTGWGYCNVPATCPNYSTSAPTTFDYVDPMLLVPNNHDLTAKTLLSYPGSTTSTINPCTGCTNANGQIPPYANASLDTAIDNLFNHPNVGPFIGRNLIQQMVTSDPTPAYVGRVAAVFNNNGFGVRGDMKAVITAILLDPEARGDVKTDPGYGKLREPVQYATNFCRALNVRSADGTTQSDGVLFRRGEFTGMGQVPLMSPTVFNYFPPDFVIPGKSFLGPEFALMTTGTSIQRVNFINRMVFTAIPIPVSNDTPQGTSLDFSDLQALSTADSTGGKLVDELNRRMLHGTMSTSMRNTIMTAVTSINASDTLGRTRQAVYLVATSSQYQVQR